MFNAKFNAKFKWFWKRAQKIFVAKGVNRIASIIALKGIEEQKFKKKRESQKTSLENHANVRVYGPPKSPF